MSIFSLQVQLQLHFTLNCMSLCGRLKFPKALKVLSTNVSLFLFQSYRGILILMKGFIGQTSKIVWVSMAPIMITGFNRHYDIEYLWWLHSPQPEQLIRHKVVSFQHVNTSVQLNLFQRIHSEAVSTIISYQLSLCRDG